MRILALIPARGGSKRLPRKNIRPLGPKPLVLWSVEAAKGLPGLCDILISTDDPEIAVVGRNSGALVPWLRPEHLATDTASSTEVALHALNWYEDDRGPVDGLLLLQPTSPFRTRETMERGIDLFLREGRRPIVGVAPARSHPMWCFHVEGQKMRPYIGGAGIGTRSQDLPEAYAINGAFYLIAAADLRRHRSFFSEDMLPLVMKSVEESIDIDTPLDWAVAEAFLVGRGAAA